MPKHHRQITETDLTKDEVHLLGALLQGIAKQNLRAGIRLVNRGWCEWGEPDGKRLVLSPDGVIQARKLWPALDEKPAVELQLPSDDGHIAAEAHQLALAVPPLVGDPAGLHKALARVIGEGGDGIAAEVLVHHPGGRGLPTVTSEALGALGVPPHAAERVRDAFVLARACRRRNDRWGRWVRTPEDMAGAVFDEFGVADLEVEHLWVGAVDSGDSLVSVNLVAQGSLSKVAVSMRDVFVPLCRARAAACFVAHNHPSGDLAFSNDDLRLTQRIMGCCARMEIALIDHIVLAPDGRYASLREEGGVW